MQLKLRIVTLLICIICATVSAQNKPLKKSGMLSYSANYSDYGFIKTVKDSSISAAFNRKGLFKSGNSSFGFGLSYWKGLGSHVDFTGNLAGTFSNFPALFIKDDSVGQAGFTPQLDALLHFRAFKDYRTINPFLTGGIGAGYFGNQFALYAPVGAGLQFYFKSGIFVFLQAQLRLTITDGINNDYMFYSVGFAQQKITKPKKEPSQVVVPVIDTIKAETKKDGINDTDGDGFVNTADECPNEKGTVRGCPDSDGDGIADKDDLCKDVPGDARYKGCPVPDTDGDGINDDDDKCPKVAGLKENNGCPADKDGDGIADIDDKCPDAAGTAENDGCPMEISEGTKLIRVKGDSMTYYIRFDFDRANITTEAFTELNKIVQILKADKTLSIFIEGHADKLGIEKYNVLISSDRANVTRDYFLSYNIARSRMNTAYYGSSMPYDINQDWLNRRVEITIYKKK